MNIVYDGNFYVSFSLLEGKAKYHTSLLVMIRGNQMNNAKMAGNVVTRVACFLRLEGLS